MNVGLVYAYRDPVTQNWAYVGSIQKQTTLNRRHHRHLKDRHVFDVWLQGMHAEGKKVQPEIMQYVGYDHVSELYKKENEWIENFGTLHPHGYNMVLAGGPDHSRMGQLGGKSFSHEDRVRAGKRTHELHPTMSSERMKRTREKHPEKMAEATANAQKRARELYPNQFLGKSSWEIDPVKQHQVISESLKKRHQQDPTLRYRVGKLGGDKKGRAGHNRWHVARGIKNPNCKLCMETT